tara:strand:+ start:2686 stop:3171 length:486 start_codon:yes stop_codon:yes gene_type:complete
MNNGRIMDIDDNKCQDISELYSEICDNLDDYKKESINHLLEENNINQYFFSKQNINYIQNHIRYEIYKKSKLNIHRQSDRELSLIMRSFYLQYSNNNDDNFINEIKYLNKLVIDYCIPKITNNVKQYIGYKKDISQMYTPMDKPESANLVGDKSLKLNLPF